MYHNYVIRPRSLGFHPLIERYWWRSLSDMANDTDIEQSQLVNRLADGFAALLKQVDELKRHNQEVEKFLGYHSYEDKVHLFLHTVVHSTYCMMIRN